MQKVWQSRPTLKQTIITLVVCLVLGVLAQGFTPIALLFLLFGISFLAMLTWRNYDPKSYELYHNPREYQLRTERNELYRQLTALTDAVENEKANIGGILLTEYTDARKLLDKVKSRYEPKTKVK